MAVKKLSHDIQALFSVTTRLTSYKRTIEELIYNSLDANSTSMAIRINIQENKIQVVDNGDGISSDDFKILGERHATSKFVDLSSLKLKGNTYGYRGQALASIISISKTVKITSKLKNSNITWSKSFYKGKDQECGISRTRPSKGTTVEISGFLFNLNIQKKAVNPLQELQDVKSFLEQLALIHNNISLSLRDDAKNEIAFKIHKKRDMYQTFKSLFDINESNIQELQVEKNEYKALAYIAKDYQDYNRQHWIFLNKIFLNNSRLHKMINDQFIKMGHLSHNSKKIKLKNIDSPIIPVSFKNRIPFYYIFLSCPYYDYNISSSPNHSDIEFKCWETISKLIEKLIRLYAGDIKLIKITKENYVCQEENTRDQVKKIMMKILGHGTNKLLGTSQMHNGIKGKLIKRKIKRKNTISLSKVITDKDNLNKTLDKQAVMKNKVIGAEKVYQIKNRNKLFHDSETKPAEHNIIHLPKEKENVSKISEITKYPLRTIKRNKLDLITAAFEKPSDTIKRRCNLLDQKAENLINYNNKKRKQKVYIRKTTNYSNIIKNNRNISVRKRIGEIIIHDYMPVNKYKEIGSKSNKRQSIKNNSVKSTYDLLKPAITSQLVTEDMHSFLHECEGKPNNCNDSPLKYPQLTFLSHKYVENDITVYYDKGQKNNTINLNKRMYNHRPTRHFNFIGNQSMDNFFKCNNELTDTLKNKVKEINVTEHHNSKISTIMNNTERDMPNKFKSIESNILYSSQNIDNNDIANNINTHKLINLEHRCSNDLVITNSRKTTDIGLTYSVTETDIPRRHNSFPISEYITNSYAATERESEVEELNSKQNENIQQDPLKVVFVSNSHHSDTGIVEPLKIYETILNSNSLDKKDLEKDEHLNKVNDTLFDTSHINIVEELLSTKQNIQVENPAQEIITQSNNDNNIVLTQHKDLESNGIDLALMESNYFNINFPDDFPIIEANNFNLRNRPRFLPKGMSPMFTKSNSKKICDYKLQQEYFNANLYNAFVQDVQIQTEVYGAKVQNTTDIITGNIEKVNTRLNKENASLTFNSQSLKEATVLGQIDEKFIAAILQGKSRVKNYLVLFDQHAVHERVRLENNLQDYYNEIGWKSIQLDKVVLKIPNDEIMYLHNYKEKFTQLGLQWTILNNCELAVYAIPKAILGKNPRQVEKVMEAVQNLIAEEISVIKTQKGCISLFPKSIMELVFSEACRYAIKFGDSLSHSQCADLIQSLSACKTPFICAHGRPVMAVITEIKSEIFSYEVDKKSIYKLKTFFNTES